MKFGIFDHVDRNDLPLHTYYEARLKLVELYDQAGFYSYHVAEHHATPLNMVPVPGVYLGAVARATSHIRLGPLGYLLPLYSPLRLIEEICILDHLCNDRYYDPPAWGITLTFFLLFSPSDLFDHEKPKLVLSLIPVSYTHLTLPTILLV